MNKFKSTYLCIKQHSVTGLKYLCKTQKSYEEMLEYKGSGRPYWNNHLKKHGRKYVETPWYCLFEEQEELTKFALMCSKQWNIVDSDEWANLRIENGVDGNPKGRGLPKGTKLGPPSDKSRAKNSASHKGRPARNKGVKQTAEHSAKKAASMFGKNKGKKYGPQSPELIQKRIEAVAKNRILVTENEKRDIARRFLHGETYIQIRKMYKFGTRKITKILLEQNINPKIRICPHCGITACSANIGKYHLDKCRNKNEIE